MKCRNCGATAQTIRGLPEAGEVRVVFECGEIEYFEQGSL
jgi:hypothetical protein